MLSARWTSNCETVEFGDFRMRGRLGLIGRLMILGLIEGDIEKKRWDY